ncbi:hypothetical protein [Streptomyces sp. HUAS ZL42]|uniref:hypothetical protein n=1 Tax=Streptomyces sp. HUAS ZL42 TaxID=3231715 RepID=UPI00345E5200
MTSPQARAFPTRRQGAHLIALGMAAAVILTACRSGSDERAAVGDAGKPKASGAPAPTGVVTRQQAAEIVDHYEAVNNKANKVRDKKLLATVEAGQTYEQSQACYEQWKAWSAKDQKEFGKAFFYRDRQYLIPATGTATWFAVKATNSNSTEQEVLMIFDKFGSTYKMVASLYEGETPLPEVATDSQGLATPVDPAKPVGALAPDQLAFAYEDLLETGGAREGKGLASTPSTEKALHDHNQRLTGNLAPYSILKFYGMEPVHKDVYALRLANGGALAVFPSAYAHVRMLKPQYMSSFHINPTEAEAVYDPAGRDSITNEDQGQGLAELTPTGKPKVIVVQFTMVDSR